MALRLLSERGCVIHPVPGLMYNLAGTQSGLSHGLPPGSEALWPAVVSSSGSQRSSLPLCWALCVC